MWKKPKQFSMSKMQKAVCQRKQFATPCNEKFKGVQQTPRVSFHFPFT